MTAGFSRTHPVSLPGSAGQSFVELSIAWVNRFCEAAKQPKQSRATAHCPGSLRNACESGFSLVELSIVLVILGLLTGGILTGQNLIRAAELRSVSSDFQRYEAAAHSFRDKYFYLPGDMPNATDFWGGTLRNGNGDGALPWHNGNEDGQKFFGHLSEAGMIEGEYGTNPNSNKCTAVTNPESDVSSAYFWAGNQLTGGDPRPYLMEKGNFLAIGSQSDFMPCHGEMFSPEEAWNIDIKLDDGLATSGKVKSVNRWHLSCNGGTDPEYRLDVSGDRCSIHYHF